MNLLAVSLAFVFSAASEPISVETFLLRASAKDTEFRRILIDGLKLRYREDLLLPSSELTLSVGEELALDLGGGLDEGAKTSVSIGKLFRLSGTEIEASYGVTPSANASSASSALAAKVSQPILRNAFGRSTRWLKRIAGLETEVARYQIAEAYEDYYARLAGIYLDWWGASETLKIGRSSFQSNQRLLENMERRRRSKIALPIDVNKIKLQVMAREERVVRFEEAFQRAANLVRVALRVDPDTPLEPVAPEGFLRKSGDFESLYSVFESRSRTYRILDRLERKAELVTAREVDALLPSLALFAGVERSGSGPEFSNPTQKASGGVSLEIPFGRPTAKRGVARIDRDIASLNSLNARQGLKARLRNLGLVLDRERTLLELARRKSEIAGAVLEDETENYTVGKATLNEYITAVNSVDSQSLDRIARELEWRKLNLEWLRLTDQLVKEIPDEPE